MLNLARFFNPHFIASSNQNRTRGRRRRSTSDLLAFLTDHEHQLESDRELVKQLVIAKVDREFDVLLENVRAHKAKIEELIRTESVSNGSNVGNDAFDASAVPNIDALPAAALSSFELVQVNNTDDDGARDVQTTLPSTSNSPVSKRYRYSVRFACIYPGCGKTCSTDNELARHERCHTGIRPFSCAWPDCHYDATQRVSVVQHIRGVHFKLPVTKKDQRALNITDDRDPKPWIRVNQQMANKRLIHADIRQCKPIVRKASNAKAIVDHFPDSVCQSSGFEQSFLIIDPQQEDEANQLQWVSVNVDGPQSSTGVEPSFAYLM